LILSKPFHTLLLAILPVLQILSVNRQNVSIGEGSQSFAVAIIFGVAVWLIFSAVLKSLKAGAIPASIFLLFFYLYTPFQLGLSDNSWTSLSRNSLLIPFLILIVSAALFVAYKGKRKGRIEGINQKLNVFSVLVCVLPLLSLFSKDGAEVSSKGDDSELVSPANPLIVSRKSDLEKPNIYWIVLDAYAREDVLKNEYSFDNSGFIRELENRGFSVDSTARSNYSQTSLSLASILNGEYLQNLSSEIKPSSSDRRLLTKLIRNNHFANSLRRNGYKTATFSTGYALTEDPNSDKYYGSRHFLGQNPVTGSLIKRTPLRLLNERIFLPLNGYDWHRDRVLDNFANLAEMPGLEAPYFAFAHFVSPHKPYIFSNSGEFSAPDMPFSFTENLEYDKDEKSLYVDQLQFVNSKILETIDSIFERESKRAIIIIQSDHGPNSDEPLERMKIFQARLIPGMSDVPTYSSVNTSRAILNHIFDAKLPFLTDQYFWSSYEEPFEFVEKYRLNNRWMTI